MPPGNCLKWVNVMCLFVTWNMDLPAECYEVNTGYVTDEASPEIKFKH